MRATDTLQHARVLLEKSHSGYSTPAGRVAEFRGFEYGCSTSEAQLWRNLLNQLVSMLSPRAPNALYRSQRIFLLLKNLLLYPATMIGRDQTTGDIE